MNVTARACVPEDAGIIGEADVLARIESGELVPVLDWGEPVVREAMVAELRERVARLNRRASLPIVAPPRGRR